MQDHSLKCAIEKYPETVFFNFLKFSGFIVSTTYWYFMASFYYGSRQSPIICRPWGQGAVGGLELGGWLTWASRSGI